MKPASAVFNCGLQGPPGYYDGGQHPPPWCARMPCWPRQHAMQKGAMRWQGTGAGVAGAMLANSQGPCGAWPLQALLRHAMPCCSCGYTEPAPASAGSVYRGATSACTAGSGQQDEVAGPQCARHVHGIAGCMHVSVLTTAQCSAVQCGAACTAPAPRHAPLPASLLPHGLLSARCVQART